MMADKLHFLVVEDEEYIALAIKAILSKNFDGDIDICQNGEEAYHSMFGKKYDLIISDWNMPKKTGDEFLKDLRANEDTKNVPFIMLTARSDRSSVITAINAGVTDYLHKPFEKNALIEKVDKLIKQSQNEEGESAEEQNENNREIERVKNRILEEIEKGTVEIPVLPGVYARLRTLAENFDIRYSDIVSTISYDDDVCRQIIRLSNTVFFGGGRDNHSLEHAVVRIGSVLIQGCLLMLSSKELFTARFSQFDDTSKKLWLKSIATARCAQNLAKRAGWDNHAELFELGFLHNIAAIWVIRILEQFDGFKAVYNRSILEGLIEALQTPLTSVLMKYWALPSSLERVFDRYAHSLPDRWGKTIQLLHLAGHVVRHRDFGVSPVDVEFPYKRHAAELGLDLQTYLMETLLNDVGNFVETVTQPA